MAASGEREEPAAFDPWLLGRMQGLARTAAALVMSIAVFVLLGWTFNVEVLRSVIPGLTAMNPGGTALAFLFAGGSLWRLTGRDNSVHMTRIAWVMAMAVVVIASLRLMLDSLGIEGGPDHWLFGDKLELYRPPNRMAPNTAFGVLLTGVALLVLDVETQRGFRPAQWLALTAGLLSMFTLAGYAYNAAVLIGLRAYIPMALNSAATLMLLAIGLLFARPDRGLMAVVSDRETGGMMARRLLPASILTPAIFAWLAHTGQWAGLFEPAFGISLFVVSTIVLFTTLIWWNARSLNRIDAERNRTQRELSQNGAILKSVLNSMGDGVVVADRAGRFLIFNPVAERIIGRGAIDAPPSQWTSEYGLFSAETGQPLKLDEIPLVRAIRGESTNQVELLVKSPHLPEGVTISVTGRPLKGDEGIEGGVVVFQDTTQRRLAAEAIRRARDEADAANRAKSEFLANMSHEIRTPMNAVIGMTELVLDSELNDAQRMYLKIVKDSAESLLSLINDILDFSKIEAGKLELDHASFQLRDVLGDTMKALSVRARGKELELACHVAPDVPEFLVGDPYRLRQVVTNLVGNALKFTDDGEVVLEVAKTDLSEEAVGLHVAVRDTGIGIPADKLHILFGAFSQVDASTTRRYGGTGLGLAIAARIVPLMGGRIWVESERGKGSTFHFTARFERDRTPPPPPATPETLQNLRVLVVDDNATNRLILQEMLTAWGMRPLCLSTAKAALDELRRAADAGDPFRVVLSDVHMPDVDGFELTSSIRQEGRFQSTVIMMLSSGAGAGDVTRSRELGAAAHLMKPIKPSELFAAIASVMGTAARGEAARETGPKPGGPLNILLAEDSEANQQLAQGVLQKWGHTLTVANNGREAVAWFERGRFDLILMDVQMPELDGFQATTQIRTLERQQGGHIPIIAMTAHAMKGDREECLRAGMDDYVTKPIRWPDLRRVVDRVARQGSSPDAAEAENSPIVAAPLRESPEWRLDWDEASRAVDGDPKLLRELLNDLRSEWPKLLTELDRAARRGDSVTLRRAAHTLRGSLRFFGSTEAVHLAAQIEELAHSGQAPAAVGLFPRLHEEVGHYLAEVKRRLDLPEVLSSPVTSAETIATDHSTSGDGRG
jgi:two-component system sensor histidine kinase/response regulator